MELCQRVQFEQCPSWMAHILPGLQVSQRMRDSVWLGIAKRGANVMDFVVLVMWWDLVNLGNLINLVNFDCRWQVWLRIAGFPEPDSGALGMGGVVWC